MENRTMTVDQLALRKMSYEHAELLRKYTELSAKFDFLVQEYNKVKKEGEENATTLPKGKLHKESKSG